MGKEGIVIITESGFDNVKVRKYKNICPGTCV